MEQIIEGVVRGTRAGAGIAAMLGTVGLLFSTFTFSGLGVKLSAGIETWTGGMLLPALLLIAAICIILGMAGLGGATYIVVSIFAVPALMKMGVDFPTSHFFIVYITAFGLVTPPVAAAAIVASKMTGAGYIQTAIEATKVALVGILLPYFFVVAPVLLLLPQETTSAFLSLIACAFFIVALQVAFVGYYLTKSTILDRCLFVAIAFIFVMFLIWKSTVLFSGGLIAFFLMTLWQWKKKKSISEVVPMPS